MFFLHSRTCSLRRKSTIRAMRNMGRNIKATTAMPIQPLECSDSVAGYAVKEDRRCVSI